MLRNSVYVLLNNAVSRTFILLMFTSSSYIAQHTKLYTTTKDMTLKEKYPRIEYYYEIDLGDPNAGSAKWTDPMGKTVYGGRADDRPHIFRKTVLLNDEQKKELLQAELFRYFYFDKQAGENISLNDYFDALANPDKNALAKLLPKNLDLFNSRALTDETFAYYSTLLAYEKGINNSLTVIWLDENTYFVNDMYYSARIDLNAFKENAKGEPLAPMSRNRTADDLSENEEMIGEINFRDFLKFSPVFQYKISEGLPHLKLRYENSHIPLDKAVIGISLSPGLPNTTSYTIQITGDGSYLKNGFKTQQKLELNKLTRLLLEAKKVYWERFNEFSMPMAKPDDDRQNFTISAWSDGKYHTIYNPNINNTNQVLMDYVALVKKTLNLE